MTSPLVSIILPTYNGQKFIHLAIESCIHQHYPYWELVVIDDASCDETSRIVKEYQARDKRIRYFRHDENKKLPAALNTGFAMAKGEYLTWTSDDNIYMPEALSCLVSFLEENKSVSMVYSNYIIIDEEGKLVVPIEVGSPEKIVQGNIIGPCFLYRYEIYEKIGGYRNQYFLVEDLDYWLRLSKYFKMHALRKELYFYRVHKHSLTATRRNEILLNTEKVLLDQVNELPWVTKKELYMCYVSLVGFARARLDLKKLWLYVRKSFRFCSPFFLGPSFILLEILLGKTRLDNLEYKILLLKAYLRKKLGKTSRKDEQLLT